MIRTFFMTALLATSTYALASPQRVPDGNYQGVGTWSDTQGNSGSATVRYHQKHGATEAYSKAVFSDGRTYEGTYLYATVNDYRYNVSIDYNGTPIPVGAGACGTSRQCHTSMQIGPEAIIETAIYNRPRKLFRSGSIHNTLTGVTTFYRVEMRR